MKTLFKLPISLVKIIIALAALPIGALVVLIAIIIYNIPTTLPAKRKSGTDEK